MKIMVFQSSARALSGVLTHIGTKTKPREALEELWKACSHSKEG